jgi:hypothetical protein
MRILLLTVIELISWFTVLVVQFSCDLAWCQYSSKCPMYRAEKQNCNEHQRRISQFHSDEQQKTAKLRSVDCCESIYTRALMSNPMLVSRKISRDMISCSLHWHLFLYVALACSSKRSDKFLGNLLVLGFDITDGMKVNQYSLPKKKKFPFSWPLFQFKNIKIVVLCFVTLRRIMGGYRFRGMY